MNTYKCQIVWYASEVALRDPAQKAFANATKNKSQAFEWQKHFCEGCVSIHIVDDGAPQSLLTDGAHVTALEHLACSRSG